ncbi:secretion protein EspA [Burkholderia ubonensis]|uniref:secretion protein EspA n=1 Tax=Burkholderia ubonensis TaxID=101571 RepID=UPI000756CAE6|nr:secretion protein EspA [Burkholderia ubonensis]KWN63608.1 secretion protein EspA [Burkholderia ubonensis]
MTIAIERGVAPPTLEADIGRVSDTRGAPNSHPPGDTISIMLQTMDLLQSQTSVQLNKMRQQTTISREAQEMADKVNVTLARLDAPTSKAELPQDVIIYMRENNVLVDNMLIDQFPERKSEVAPHLAKLTAMIEKAGPDGMQSMPWQDVVSYMDSKGIKIDGKRVDDYIWSLPEVDYRPHQKVSLEHMNVIKEALQASTGLNRAELMSVSSSLESISARASDFVQQGQLEFQRRYQGYTLWVTNIHNIQSMLSDSVKGIASAIR